MLASGEQNVGVDDHGCAEFAKLLMRFTNPLPGMLAEIESGEPGRKRQSRRTAIGKHFRGAEFK